MSLTPAFEIGLWNAWIPAFYHLLSDVTLISLINKQVLNKAYAAPPATNSKEKMNYILLTLVFWSLSIYSIFVPLKLGTLWFHVGLPICLLGAAMHTVALMNYATASLDEPTTRGIYRISRHPLYFSAFLLFIGAGVTSASWVLLLGSILWLILEHPVVIAEERFCLAKYGDVYREYMDRVPRYAGVPGLKRR